MIRVAALIAKEHGLAGLAALEQDARFHLVALCTHRRLPKSEDPRRSERPDFPLFQEAAKRLGCPLYAVDSSSDQQKLEKQMQNLVFDALVSISWRRFIPLQMLQKAAYGGVNLHRGRLPDYPGAEPIKQALLACDPTITITAHRLEEIIDAGQILCTATLTTLPSPHLALEERISEIKRALTPLFGPLTLQALNRLIDPDCY